MFRSARYCSARGDIVDVVSLGRVDHHEPLEMSSMERQAALLITFKAVFLWNITDRF